MDKGPKQNQLPGLAALKALSFSDISAVLRTRSVSRSVGRAFEMLESFHERRAPATLTSLKDFLGHPYSSLRSIAIDLQELGYLQYNQLQKSYFPTAKLARLCGWVTAAGAPAQDFSDVLKTISPKVGETTALAVTHHILYFFTRVMPGTLPFSLHIPAGIGRPLVDTVTGRALMSQMNADEVEQIYQYTRYWADLSHAKPATEKSELIDILAATRAQGYIVKYGVLRKDIGTIAVPFARANPNDARSVISISGPTDRLRSKQAAVLETVRDALARAKS